MPTNRKVMHFIHGEKQAQRLESFSLETSADTGLTRTCALLVYKTAQMGHEAAGALHGMGCHIISQEIVLNDFVLKVGMPHNVTFDGEHCEACKGTGVFNGEQCWHCEGEGIDPTF